MTDVSGPAGPGVPSRTGSGWTGLHRFSIRRPATVLGIAAVVMAAAAPGILRLRLRTDGQALIPERAPAVRLDREVRAAFGIRDPIVVLLRSRHRDGIFTPSTLRLVTALSDTLGRLPGLDAASVRSLATETGDRFRPGTLEYRRLLEPVPETARQLDELRGDLEAIGLHTGTLVSFDGEATAILVGTPPLADRWALVAAIQAAVSAADTAGHDVAVIGAPVAEALFGRHILQDLGLGRGLGGLAGRSDAGLGAASRLRLAIARHVGLLPLTALVLALVFLVGFRSLTATLLALGEAAACLVFVFGAMGWADVPVYLTMAILPVILVSMGLADEIHVFSSYCRHRAERPAAPIAEVVRAALDDICVPVVATSLTTAVGFLSFALSPLDPVRAFGLCTAAGILFCMLWSLTVIPALLVLLAPRGIRALGGSSAAGAWGAAAGLPSRRPAATLALAALGLTACGIGIGRLVVQDGWISGFARDSAFYRATQVFNERFFGTHRLLLALDAGRVEARGRLAVSDLDHHELRLPAAGMPDPEMLAGCSLVVSRPAAPPRAGGPDAFRRPSSWASLVERAEIRDGRLVVATPAVHGSALFLLAPARGESLDFALRSRRLASPRVLRAVEDLEAFLRAQDRYTVGGVLGPPDYVATAEYLTNERDPESRRIPSDPERVLWLWDAMRRTHGDRRLAETVDRELRRGLVVVHLKDANYVDTARLLDTLRAYARERLEPERIALAVGGDVATSQTLIEAIVDSQVRSLLASLLGIVAVVAVLFRSIGWGAICALPAGAGVAVAFAFMGWTGVPLGVATSMFAGMVLGVGVDFAIHLAQRYRRSVQGGAANETAIAAAVAATGPAITVNALAVGLGFGVLVLSEVPANARLGAIAAVSLFACLAATLAVIPALLGLRSRGAARPPVS